MSNREQYIITGATSVDSSSPEMLVPVSGAVLTIEGMTSGNVLLEQYLSAGWTTIATYTADTVVKVGIAPGNLIRISWNTVVGTPSISVLPASDNGFAEVATDISVIEADITEIQDAVHGILILDADEASYTVSDSDSPFSTIAISNGTESVVFPISVSPTVAAQCSGTITVYNSGIAPVKIFFTGNEADAVYVAAGQTEFLVAITVVSKYVLYDSRVKSIASSGTQYSLAGPHTETTAIATTIPAYLTTAGGSITITIAVRSSASAGTRTFYVKLGNGAIGAATIVGEFTIGATLNASSAIRIANRTASTQHAKASAMLGGLTYNPAAAFWTSSIASTSDMNLYVSTVSSSTDTIYIESYEVTYTP